MFAWQELIFFLFFCSIFQVFLYSLECAKQKLAGAFASTSSPSSVRKLVYEN